SPSTAPVNSGTVTFRDTTTNTTLGTSTVSGTGLATLPASFAAAGVHNVTAVYNGSAPSFNASPTVSLLENVLKVATVSVNPIVAPNNAYSLTLNFAISVTGSGSPGPSGTVTITETIGPTTTTLGTGMLSGGAVTIPVSG